MKKLFTKQTAMIGFIFFAAFILSRTSHAYLAVNETAELLPDGYFKFGVAPQLRLSDGGGLNVGAFFDTFIADDLNGRFELGGGKTDFWSQASVKWVPFPDVERQPALGIRGAFIYARDENLDFYNFQVAPMMSKVADTRYGKMIPFVALPITFMNTKNNSTTATQFTVGAEWFSNKDMHVGAEIDLNLSKSYTSVSTFISFPFDAAIGYKK
ncbi:MAG: hypothetical protein H7328_01640 [Bdellovibrio sp.]|nr:hypothetical protein [Bdellovibrio sp.]